MAFRRVGRIGAGALRRENCAGAVGSRCPVTTSRDASSSSARGNNFAGVATIGRTAQRCALDRQRPALLLGSRGVGAHSSPAFVSSRDNSSSTVQAISSPPPFPPDNYRPYKRAATKILSSSTYRKRRDSLKGQGVWNEGVVRAFEGWLLGNRPAVDEQITLERWGRLREEWVEGSAGREGEGGGSEEIESSCISSELTSQREALVSAIVEASGESREKDGGTLLSQSLSRMADFVLCKLVERCIDSPRPVALPVIWYKAKESGVVLHPSKARELLGVASTSVLHGGSLYEEIAMYCDLLCGAGEKSDHARYATALRRGDANGLLALLRERRPMPSSAIKYDKYAMALVSMAEAGHFSSSDAGARLFDRIAADMEGQGGEISESVALRLHNALTKSFGSRCEGASDDVPDRDCPVKDDELVSCRVELDSLDICPVTKVHLSRAYLSPVERTQLYDDILALGRRQIALSSELKKFTEWLSASPPFAFILDGQNMGAGNIKRVTAESEAAGHAALAVVSEEIAEHLEGFCDSTHVYVVPDGLDDDLLCLYATAALKTQPLLLSRDSFRDHIKRMRDPELARRWVGNRCRDWNYNIGKLRAPSVPKMDRNIRTEICHDLLEIADARASMAAELEKFSLWMKNREGHPFTAVLDGANVHTTMGMLEGVVSSLEAKGEYPLVVLPENIAFDLTELTYRLQIRGNLYIVPHGHDDDLFCIIATVAEQKQSQHDSRSDQPRACQLITNDRFLDHKGKVRDKALFGKWYQQHCDAYSYAGGFTTFAAEDVYEMIEGNEWPVIDKESKAYNQGGKVWHFPVRGWCCNKRYVVRLPFSEQRE